MNDPLFVIDGRVMLVAGGAGGLGTPLAAALAERGAKVLIADIGAQRAQKTARELAATHKADIRACALDVVSPQSCAAAVDLAVSAWGRLDGLVNATGIYRVAGALELDEETWERTIRSSARRRWREFRWAALARPTISSVRQFFCCRLQLHL
jgi:NAD(P)-dependent dehydrogenase (short-subunit alcohol dehydrogenase family)